MIYKPTFEELLRFYTPRPTLLQCTHPENCSQCDPKWDPFSARLKRGGIYRATHYSESNGGGWIIPELESDVHNVGTALHPHWILLLWCLPHFSPLVEEQNEEVTQRILGCFCKRPELTDA